MGFAPESVDRESEIEKRTCPECGRKNVRLQKKGEFVSLVPRIWKFKLYKHMTPERKPCTKGSHKRVM